MQDGKGNDVVWPGRGGTVVSRSYHRWLQLR